PRHGRRAFIGEAAAAPSSGRSVTQRGSQHSVTRSRNRQQPQRTGGTPPVVWRALGFALPTRKSCASDAELMEAAFAARRASPQQPGSLGRSPSLSRQQQRQQRQSPTEPVGSASCQARQLPARSSSSSSKLSRTAVKPPTWPNSALYGGGGGAAAAAAGGGGGGGGGGRRAGDEVALTSRQQ
uniref:Kinesin motor domain-containing protein n=1 Tax=Macrostomum lignano TaxID=282301 RepID=A0A1I8FKT2_9PLAT